MRQIYILLTFLMSAQLGFSQLYATLGVSKRNEGGGYYDPKLCENLFSSSIHDYHKMDYYNLGITYKKRSFVLDAQLGLTYNDHHLSWLESTTHYYNNGVFSESHREYKQLDVRYTYFGPKVTFSKAFMPSKRFNFLIGGFVHLEILGGEKERNHRDSVVNYYQGAYFNTTTMQIIPTSSSTYSMDYSVFDGFSAVSGLISLGLSFSPTLTIKRFRIAPTLAMGWNLYPRKWVNEKPGDWSTAEEPRRLFTEIGLMVGYRLK